MGRDKYTMIHIKAGDEYIPLVIKKYRLNSKKGTLRLGKKEFEKNIKVLGKHPVVGGWVQSLIPFIPLIAPIVSKLLNGNEKQGSGITEGGFLEKIPIVGPLISGLFGGLFGRGLITGNYVRGGVDGGRIFLGQGLGHFSDGLKIIDKTAEDPTPLSIPREDGKKILVYHFEKPLTGNFAYRY